MTGWWNLASRRRERAANDLQARLTALRAELRGHVAVGLDLATATEHELHDALADNAESIATTVTRTLPPELSSWDPGVWAAWAPDGAVAVRELRVGELVEAGTGQGLALPATATITCATPPIVITSRTPDERSRAISLLQSVVIRLAADFPKQARFALFDPVGRGTSFPMSRRLERVLLGFEVLQRPLEELSADLQRIESSYLDRHHRTLDDVPVTLRLAESPQFVVASSFPSGFDDWARATLLTIATSGSKAGIHSVIHLDLSAGDAAQDALGTLSAAGAIVLDLAGTTVSVEGVDMVVEFDEAPAGGVQETILQRIAVTPRRDHPVPWHTIQELADEDRWTDSADQLIAAPIGRAAADQVYDLWFGTDPELGRGCNHGIIVGTAAAGRQYVFDALLAGLATRYAPNQLHFTLVEGPHQRSFEAWKRLPHTEVVALTPSPEQARNALTELRFEADRRLADFDRLRVTSFTHARDLEILAELPRVLAVIDGYEQLFEGALDDGVINDLRRVLTVGERVGIHLLLGGSRFDRAGALHRAGLFDLVDLRVALQLAQDDSLGRDEFGVKGVRLVQRVCDRPFRAVVNSMHGHDDANLATQLAVLQPVQRDELISRLVELAAARQSPVPATHVLNGSEQPQLVENPYVMRLLESDSRRTPDAVREFARTSPRAGGLGIDDWNPEERPRLLFVGQEETLHGQAHFVLRRRPTENVAIVMADRDLRVGTLGGLLVSSVLTDQPESTELWIVDRTPVGGPSSEVLEQTARRCAQLDVSCRFTRSGDEAAQYIAAVGAEIGRRRGMGDAEVSRQPTVLLVLADPERIALLNRVPTPQGVADSPLGTDLRYVLMQGPAVGVHVVVASSSLTSMRTVLSDQVMHQEFRHRLVTRLAEEDSFALLRSSVGASLSAGAEGRASTGLLFDGHTQARVVFRPYSAGTPETNRTGNMTAQIGEVFDQLAGQLQS